MEAPKGMSERSIWLSDSQAETHEFSGSREIRGVVDRNYRDGWVQQGNRHLSGNLLIFRNKPTSNGPSRHYELVPIDNALVQNEYVETSINTESDRIDGYRADDGHYEPGELDTLVEVREQLFDWKNLPNEARAEIIDFFTGATAGRKRAINPLNKAIGARAARMAQLQKAKNPQATLATTHPFERDLEARFTELVGKNLGVTGNRKSRLGMWVFEENQQLKHAYELLGRIVNDQKEDNKVSLMLMARNLRFRVQPFNMFEHYIRQTGHRIEDPSVAVQAQEGLRFHRQAGGLLLPFRKLTKVSPGEFTDNFATEREARAPLLEERGEVLETMEADMTPGPYKRLAGRVLLEFANATTAFDTSSAPAFLEHAKTAKWLINYLCLPKDDPEEEVFYRYKLY